MNTVGKSAFVEAVGRASDDASGYLDFFKGEIGKTHLAQELWTQIDNGQLAPDLAEIRTSITDVSNEITQTVNKKLEDQSAAIQQIQKVQVDTNNNLNSMWAVKLQQMQDGRLYIAGIGAGIENTPAGMQSQVLLAADRIAMINPANGNTKPMFVGQGDQIFMNDVFLKRLTAPTITSGGNPPAFSLTPDGKLTAKNADISGSVNANSGTLNNVTINENCQIKGKLSANQIEGDIVKTVGKAFPRDSRAPERWPSGTITVRIYDNLLTSKGIHLRDVTTVTGNGLRILHKLCRRLPAVVRVNPVHLNGIISFGGRWYVERRAIRHHHIAAVIGHTLSVLHERQRLPVPYRHRRIAEQKSLRTSHTLRCVVSQALQVMRGSVPPKPSGTDWSQRCATRLSICRTGTFTMP